MLRLHEKDINSPEYFETMWKMEGVHKYDTVRLRAILANITHGNRICDLGCGLFGFAQYALAEMHLQIAAWAVDFCPYALAKAKEAAPKLHISLANVLNTPFMNREFDMVGAGEVIEHMEKPEELVKEMARICKSGGHLVITTVDPDCEDGKHLEYPEHLWRFTKEELMDFFKPYGAVAYKLVGNYHFVECRKS